MAEFKMPKYKYKGGLIRFPKACSKKNCPHFKSWESGIMEITCRCKLLNVECDADDEILQECPLYNNTEDINYENQSET